ncbi:RnfH family protein [Acinetobacter sp. Ac_877]|nr:RnfH family protein [Acinetobacter portensis]MPW41322.1 RnfH family protein [Acinetobacter portensis]
MSQDVWVAYAAQDQQFNIRVDFVEGMTALDAIDKSGIREQVELPENLQLGVFGVRLKDLSQVIEIGDRVEIYRALTINPKEIRRKRAENNPTSRYCRSNRFKQLK